jgi:hypothetical protein
VRDKIPRYKPQKTERIKKDVIKKAVNLYRAECREIRKSNSYGGNMMNDGGYSKAVAFIEIFCTVWDKKDLPKNRMPRFLKEYIKEAGK